MTGFSQTDADQYQKFFNETTSDKKRTLAELQQLLIKTAEHWRAFTSTLLTIDIAVVAALLSVITSENSHLIQNQSLSIVGVLFLVVDAILIVYYSIGALYNDDVSLSARNDFFEKANDEVIEMALEHIQAKKPFLEFDTAYVNKLADLVERERLLVSDAKKKEKSGKWLLLLGYLFILGLVFSVLSVIPCMTGENVPIWHLLFDLQS
ncbi:MAG: hypothetical protein JWN18_358 [Parcubacteria group bacterium]|nr:hypothetical protein [Parcubacteria group bacterium]